MRNPRENLTKIKEILTPTTNLFNYIGYDLTDTTLTNEMLSFLFYSRAANRWCSPFIDNFIVDNDGEKEISEQSLQMLGRYVKGILQPNWDKFKAVALEEYDPIHNFSSVTTETISDEKENTRTNDLTRTDNLTRTDDFTRTDNLTKTDNFTRTDDLTRTDNLTRTDSLTKTDSYTRTDNTTRTDEFTSGNTRTEDIDTTEKVNKSDNSSGESGVYGFNSDDSVSTDTNTSELLSDVTTDKDGTVTTTDSGTNGGTSRNTGTVTNAGTSANTGTVTNTGTSANSGTVTNAGTSANTGTVTNTGTSANTGTVKDTGTQTDSGTYGRERETTQTGNIGNLSTQKLLTEEIELWQWNFAEQMVTDVMRLLTLSIY